MFRMDLGSGEYGGHVVVALRGELDLLYAPTVATALGALASRQPRIIVNLAGLEFIDVSGIAALAQAAGTPAAPGGTCCWPRPAGPVRRILRIVWEADGFAIYASVAEAAASSGASRQVVSPRELARMRWQHIALASAGHSALPAAAAPRLRVTPRTPTTTAAIRTSPTNDHDVLPIELADRICG